PGGWSQQHPDHLAPHRAERDQHLDGAGQSDRWRRDRHRGVVELPGARRAAADAGLGADAGRGPHDAAGGPVVADDLPWGLYLDRGAGRESAGRLAARPPRSAAAQPLMATQGMAEPLLSVRDLQTVYTSFGGRRIV